MFRRLMRERRVAFYAVMAVKAGEKYELGGMMGEQDAGMNHGSLIRGESFPLTSTDSGCYALAYQ
eukprot:2560736-Rhodomonas_salina.3